MNSLSTQFQNRKIVDSVKGILIILIVLGHSTIADSLIPVLKTIVYSFHVHCFLLIPFLFPARPFNRSNVIDSCSRYLIPYLCFGFLLSVLNGLLITHVSFTEWCFDFSRAMVTGNALYLKKSCGFYLYWFVPVLFILNLARSLYYHQSFSTKCCLFFFVILAHLLLPAMPWEFKQHFPFFGVHIALFIFPLGLTIRWAMDRFSIESIKKARWLLAVVFFLLILIMLGVGSSVNLGHLGYYSYRSPFLLILHDSISVFALLTLLAFTDFFVTVPFLAFIGSRSFIIYLTSQLFVYAVSKFFRWQPMVPLSLSVQYVAGCLSVLASIALPLLLSTFIYSRKNLKSLIFPRNRIDLLVGFRNCWKLQF